MQLIGLTGGIASGKSVVAARLAEHGAVVVDADRVARAVVEPGTPALARIAEEFGDSVLASDGSLDRAALASLIFSSPERRAALNAITHPAVGIRSKELFAAAAAADPDAIVVYDVPLLVDAGRTDEFDMIVVVNASTETRVNRMIELRGMTRDEAMHRINSQATNTERLAIADVVIDSNGTVEQTLEQADALWEKLSARVGGPT
ncbi:MAG: dephospho-CoA kinase [Pseudolysinimonas sp.]